jgi:hypothetical protein
VFLRTCSSAGPLDLSSQIFSQFLIIQFTFSLRIELGVMAGKRKDNISKVQRSGRWMSETFKT